MTLVIKVARAQELARRNKKDPNIAAIQTVLREMMEPTDKMTDAGTTNEAFADGHRPRSSIWWNPNPIWQAMLTAFAQQHNIEIGGEGD